jgi:hypothetical protein
LQFPFFRKKLFERINYSINFILFSSDNLRGDTRYVFMCCSTWFVRVFWPAAHLLQLFLEQMQNTYKNRIACCGYDGSLHRVSLSLLSRFATSDFISFYFFDVIVCPVNASMRTMYKRSEDNHVYLSVMIYALRALTHT